MSLRASSTFAPSADKFTSFSKDLIMEGQRAGLIQSSSWLSNAAKMLFGSASIEATSDKKFHELMVCALPVDRASTQTLHDGDMVQKYIAAYLPTHLLRARLYTDASKLLVDRSFIRQRVKALGIVDASQHHMMDLVELRKGIHTSKSEKNIENITITSESLPEQSDKIDSSKIVRESSRRLIETVRQAEDAGDKIDVAICLGCVGENLLKAKQTKESIYRLEETISALQTLLGHQHVEVARSLNALAKAYIKAGDDQSALSKLIQADTIYALCNATQSNHAISNSQLIATLYVENGDLVNASSKFDEIIRSKAALHGEMSLPVARALNDYAIILAKHSRMTEALKQYDSARAVFEALDKKRNENNKYSFDVTLIDLNIASIKSKLADYQGALVSYERGVSGLRSHMQKESLGSVPIDENRFIAEKKHFVSAIGRIGSLRMKLRDNTGALEAYLTLIQEVDKSSPESSRMEKAKAYVKCATIVRQIGGPENNEKAVSHLQKALEMYTDLYGIDHKDTKAINSSLKQWQKADAANKL